MKSNTYAAADNRPQSAKKRGKKKAFGSPIKIKRKKNEVAIDVDGDGIPDFVGVDTTLDVSEVTKPRQLLSLFRHQFNLRRNFCAAHVDI